MNIVAWTVIIKGKQNKREIMAKLSLTQIVSGLKNGLFKIMSVSAAKSEVWQQFGIAVDNSYD